MKAAESELYGYRCNVLERKQYAEAEGLFKINIINYPESYNIYYSYGDSRNNIGYMLNLTKAYYVINNIICFIISNN